MLEDFKAYSELIKAIREFIDWAQGKGTSIVNYVERKKLNKIINCITDLMVNKRIYLSKIQYAIQSGNQEQIDFEIRKALDVAQKDTNHLLEEIKDTKLKESEIYRVLNLKASLLANIKLTEVERLKELIGEGDTSENISKVLSKYDEKWEEIGAELEEIKNTTVPNSP